MEPVNIIPLTIRTDWDVPWAEAVIRSGRNSQSDLNIFEAGEKYRSDKTGVTVDQALLLDFGDAWRRPEALSYLEAKNLRPAHPRQAMSIGENSPKLPHSLFSDFLYVVSLMPCIVPIRGVDVEFVMNTLVYHRWSESRLMSAGYIFEPFRWVLAEENINA